MVEGRGRAWVSLVTKRLRLGTACSADCVDSPCSDRDPVILFIIEFDAGQPVMSPYRTSKCVVQGTESAASVSMGA